MRFTFTSSLASEPVRIAVRPGSSAIAIGEDVGFSFDGEGRLLTASEAGVVYKRGLNHHFVAKRHVDGRRETRDLADDDVTRIVSRTSSRLRELLVHLPADCPDPLVERLREAAAWDTDRYQEDRRRFASIYRPIGILPPDQYMAAVVQATEGCHYNRCTFCAFYREMPFRVKGEEEFRIHAEQVRSFLGRGLGARRSLFLADANALVASQRRVVSFLETLAETFELAPAGLRGRELGLWRQEHPEGLNGVYSFMDAFSGEGKSVEEFEELARLGLRRIYIGMESGHEPLLAFLAKPSLPADVSRVVSRARTAGVNVGVIVMTGVGGDRYADGHVADTIDTLNRLPLGAGDLVYLSPFREDPRSAYPELARRIGLQPLSGPEIERQTLALKRGLRLPPGVQVSVYDLEEFLY